MNYRVYLGEENTQYVNIECDHMEETATDTGDVIVKFVDSDNQTVAMFCLTKVAGMVCENK